MFYEPQLDPLTGLLTRPALLATLFRETDRVQRSRQPISLALLAIDDFEHWKARLTRLQCDALLQGAVERPAGYSAATLRSDAPATTNLF